jgi:heparosan-N-sulfate-glucuronate 5-epimerase
MPSYQYYKRIFDAYIFKKNQSNLSFWHTPLSVNMLGKIDLEQVRKYPQNFVNKTRYRGKVDSDGIIQLNYYGDIGYQYNPNAIAQVGLGYFDLFTENGSDESKQSTISNANWFLRNGRLVKDDVLLWEYEFPFEMRKKLEKPWRSALAQGQAISLLIRAHLLTFDDIYAEAAQKGFNAFRYEGLNHEGGVLSKDSKKDIWLEEVIMDPPNHILNGFIWALWGVYDYAKYFCDSYAHSLSESCVQTLDRNLYRYDLGYWTSYDLVSKYEPIMIVSYYYQTLHIIQMLGCHGIFGNGIFYESYTKWKEYLESPFCKYRALFEKIFFKLRYF